MKQTIRIVLPTVLLSIILLLLRRWQLATAFDADGIPISGSVSTWALIACAAAAVLIWILLSRTLTPSAALTVRRQPVAGLIGLLGGAAIALAAYAALYRHAQHGIGLTLLIDAGSMAAALCLCVSAGLLFSGRAPHPAVGIVPYLALLLLLIREFRRWCIDPIVIDYCFRHFTLICAMCGLYGLTSLRLGTGKRRLTAFLAMGGFCFGVTAMAGLTTADDILLYGGLALTLLSALLQLASEPLANEPLSDEPLANEPQANEPE